MTSNKAAIGILGTGSYVPETIITNKKLEEMVDTSDEWITTRTGIKERRFADEMTATSDLATKAAERALLDANVSAEELAMIIVATVSPDMLFPSTACIVQENIGAKNAYAFDISAACSGFIFAMRLAYEHIQANKGHKVLIIGAETISKLVDKEDRGTVVLFGDGAGAAVIGEKETGGILSFALGSDGAGGHLLQVPGGGSREPFSQKVLDERRHYLTMNGKEVYKFAVKIMGEATISALEQAGLTTAEVDYLIPHQANIRIIDGALKRLDIAREKVFVNLDRYGNMSAASIAVALDEAAKEKGFKANDLVVIVGFGAGLTWGACVFQW